MASVLHGKLHNWEVNQPGSSNISVLTTWDYVEEKGGRKIYMAGLGEFRDNSIFQLAGWGQFKAPMGIPAPHIIHSQQNKGVTSSWFYC